MHAFAFASNWWLRSPNSNNSNNARYVNDNGNVGNDNVNNSNNGVRPDLLAKGFGPGILAFRSKSFGTIEQSKGTSFLAADAVNLAILNEHAFCLDGPQNWEDGPFYYESLR